MVMPRRILAVMLVCLAAADAHRRFAHAAVRDEPLDVSVDLYHRVQAKMFLPDREPLMLDWSDDSPLTWRTPSGTFEYAPPRGSSGLRRIYLDWQAVSAHHSIQTRNGDQPNRLFFPQ